MKGSIKRYCSCKDPATGKQLGARCPTLTSDTKHGQWEYRDRFATTTGTRPFRRRSMATKKAASEFRTQVYSLLALSRGERHSLAKLGDLVFEATRRGGQLPDLTDVRRRLGLGLSLDRSQTVGEWLDAWVAGKRKSRRESTALGYQEHVDNYLRPLLGEIALDRLSPEHVNDMFDLLEERNAEIELARIEDRKPILEKDTRRRKAVVGAATQRRIFATLRNALNAAWKARRIDTNPCHFVEMPPEHREPARVWAPAQVGTFLDFTAEDPLHLLYRLVLLRGLRRGEVTGLRWQDIDLESRQLRVTRPLLQLGGRVVASTPKTRAGERSVTLDVDSAALLKTYRTQRKRDRLAWGEAYEDNDLVFARADGTATPPDYVSRHFRELLTAAGLPLITLHMGRHTAASLALEAGVDIKIVSDQLGHSTTTITRDLYQHVRRAIHDGAAEAVVALLPSTKTAKVAQ